MVSPISTAGVNGALAMDSACLRLRQRARQLGCQVPAQPKDPLHPVLCLGLLQVAAEKGPQILTAAAEDAAGTPAISTLAGLSQAVSRTAAGAGEQRSAGA
eukprot:3773276-Pyramimonas_sp.AAC.1